MKFANKKEQILFMLLTVDEFFWNPFYALFPLIRET